MNYQLFENVIYEKNAEAFSKIEFKLSLYSARYDNINESFTRTNPDIKFNKEEQNAVLSIFECFRNDYIINICKNNNSLNEGVIDKVTSNAKTASAFIKAVGANVKNLSKEAIADIKSIWKWFKDIAAAGIKSVKDMIMKFMELLSKTGDTMCDAIINLIGNLDDPFDNPEGKNYFDKIDKLAIFAKPKEGAGFLNTINYIISKRQDVFRKLKLNESADSLYDNYYNNLNEGILSSTADNKAARWFFGIKNPEGKVDWKRSILASLAASAVWTALTWIAVFVFGLSGIASLPVIGSIGVAVLFTRSIFMGKSIFKILVQRHVNLRNTATKKNGKWINSDGEQVNWFNLATILQIVLAIALPAAFMSPVFKDFVASLINGFMRITGLDNKLDEIAQALPRLFKNLKDYANNANIKALVGPIKQHLRPLYNGAKQTVAPIIGDVSKQFKSIQNVMSQLKVSQDVRNAYEQSLGKWMKSSYPSLKDMAKGLTGIYKGDNACKAFNFTLPKGLKGFDQTLLKEALPKFKEAGIPVTMQDLSNSPVYNAVKNAQGKGVYGTVMQFMSTAKNDPEMNNKMLNILKGICKAHNVKVDFFADLNGAVSKLNIGKIIADTLVAGYTPTFIQKFSKQFAIEVPHYDAWQGKEPFLNIRRYVISNVEIGTFPGDPKLPKFEKPNNLPAVRQSTEVTPVQNTLPAVKQTTDVTKVRESLSVKGLVNFLNEKTLADKFKEKKQNKNIQPNTVNQSNIPAVRQSTEVAPVQNTTLPTVTQSKEVAPVQNTLSTTTEPEIEDAEWEEIYDVIPAQTKQIVAKTVKENKALIFYSESYWDTAAKKEVRLGKRIPVLYISQNNLRAVISVSSVAPGATANTKGGIQFNLKGSTPQGYLINDNKAVGYAKFTCISDKQDASIVDKALNKDFMSYIKRTIAIQEGAGNPLLKQDKESGEWSIVNPKNTFRLSGMTVQDLANIMNNKTIIFNIFNDNKDSTAREQLPVVNVNQKIAQDAKGGYAYGSNSGVNDNGETTDERNQVLDPTRDNSKARTKGNTGRQALKGQELSKKGVPNKQSNKQQQKRNVFQKAGNWVKTAVSGINKQGQRVKGKDRFSSKNFESKNTLNLSELSEMLHNNL
jgi:hypothetical protein